VHGRSRIHSQVRKASGPMKEMVMKFALFVASLLLASAAVADENCVKNARGQVVCSNGQKAVAVNPNTGNVTTAQKPANGVTTAQGGNGSTAAYNSKTGNAAVATTNQNGVTTTQTSRGGEAKSKNGNAAVEGPNGTVCAKGQNKQGCTKK
jgi:hypothetical protein